VDSISAQTGDGSESDSVTGGMANRLFAPSAQKRLLFFFLSDALLIALSLYLAFNFHFNLWLESRSLLLISQALPFFILVKQATFAVLRVYRINWRFVGINELHTIGVAIPTAQMILMALFLLPTPSFLPTPLCAISLPSSVFFLDGMLSFLFVCALRISRRVFFEILLTKTVSSKGKRTLVVGAGLTGELVLRDMARRNFADFLPVGLLDDDPMKAATYIHGVQVLGTADRLPELVAKHGVEVIVIAIPSTQFKALRKIYQMAKAAGVEQVKLVPRMYKNNKRLEVDMKDIQDIGIEDLIGRQSVEVESECIEQMLSGKSVLISGACGSIGSEIVRQVCGFNPTGVALFEIDETELHNMQLRLTKEFPEMAGRIHYIVGDVRDQVRLREVLGSLRPQLVFHCAAYKHVPMMEHNASEAVKVNIFGTYHLAGAALESGVEKFIMISTDKAVRPTSIMGATKRVAEFVCSAFSQAGQTEFTSVRFGNVLGSRGSVLPLFMEQLKNGGPITVTDKEMTRFFMTIPEAVSLVLQAAVIGKNGEVMVLDMGEPVRVVQLAEELIRLHGLKPYEDIPIRFIGLRPGEKLFEEILTAEEGTTSTRHQKIFAARSSNHTMGQLEEMLRDFTGLPETVPGDDCQKLVRAALEKHVQHFLAKGQPADTGLARAPKEVPAKTESSVEGDLRHLVEDEAFFAFIAKLRELNGQASKGV